MIGLTLIANVVGWLTGGFADKIVDLGKSYFNKEISEAEFKSRVDIATQEAAAKVEASWADALKSTTESVQATLRTSIILQRAYAITLFMQVAVLFFYQIIAPAFQVITGVVWPSPGVTLEWAYLLIGAMIGAGPLVFRRQP